MPLFEIRMWNFGAMRSEGSKAVRSDSHLIAPVRTGNISRMDGGSDLGKLRW